MKNRIVMGIFLCVSASVTFGQNMTVKDSDTHVLMQVEDKGTSGALSVSAVSTDSVKINSMGAAPNKTANKLYNVGGNLYWNTIQLGGAGGWVDGGSNVYLSTSADDVGIGTSTPAAKLDIQGTLNVGMDDTGYDVNFYGSDSDSRMFWDESKMAFRVGEATGTEWDDANVGELSVAMGYNTTASDQYSTAMGYGTIASNYNSTAIGRETVSSGLYSTAMGYKSTASGSRSTAMGRETTASGSYSTSMGYHTTASASYTTSMGYYATASGDYSTAIGYYAKAESNASVAIGRYNVGGGNAMIWEDSDPVFEIGIGSSEVDTANAVTVLKNGNVGIGTTSPDYLLEMESSGGGYYDVSDHSWHNASSRKLKQDIVSNQMNVLEILDQVDIVNYRFKTTVAEDPDAAYHIGFIAEDTPELLSGRDRNSMATGNCIGLLLATVKEQQVMIDAQEEIISGLQEQIKRIEMQLELFK